MPAMSTAARAPEIYSAVKRHVPVTMSGDSQERPGPARSLRGLRSRTSGRPP